MTISYSATDIPSQQGKTILITGANTGLGLATASLLAGKGARVLLGCRDQHKAGLAMQAIVQEHADADLGFVPLDLGNLASVRQAAELVGEERQLDVLINNAGVMVPPLTLTADGFESQFGINHLGHYALTALLLDKLESSVDGRVVNVASTAHRFGHINFADLQAARGYRAGERYAMSKLANLLFTFELHRRLHDASRATIALACHPGGADTDLARHIPSMIYRFVRPIAQFVINSPEEGALPALRAATDLAARGADYYGPAGWFEVARSATRVQPSLRSRNPADAERLWRLSEELTGIPMPL